MRHLAIAIALCSLGALTNPAQAQNSGGTPSPLKVWLRREAAPFVEPRYTAMINAGKNKFAFLVPDGFYLRGDPGSGTLTLANAGGNCSLTFTVLPSGSSHDSDLDADAFREWVLRDYSSGKIAQEFSVSAGGGSGPGFDLQWQASGTIQECKRVIFISSKAGVLKFTATTSSNNFQSVKSVLRNLLLTFRISTDGELKVPPLPSDS
jgi:hypothetical protein